MRHLLRTRHVFINSKNRDPGQKPCQYTITLPSSLIRCDDDEVMSVSLQSFTCFRGWPTCISGVNDTVVVKQGGATTTCVLPPGNYSGAQLARTLQNMLPESVAVAYVPAENRMMFSADDPQKTLLRLEFPNESYKLLGFAAGETPEGQVVRSSSIIQPPLLESIMVKMTNIAPIADEFNLSNTLSNELEPCTILAAFPCNAGPWNFISWENPSGSHYETVFDDTVFSTLAFEFCDFEGRLLDELGDHTVVLRLSVYQRHLQTEPELLSRIEDRIRDLQVMVWHSQPQQRVAL